jgi:hypothetical protein
LKQCYQNELGEDGAGLIGRQSLCEGGRTVALFEDFLFVCGLAPQGKTTVCLQALRLVLRGALFLCRPLDTVLQGSAGAFRSRFTRVDSALTVVTGVTPFHPALGVDKSGSSKHVNLTYRCCDIATPAKIEICISVWSDSFS